MPDDEGPDMRDKPPAARRDLRGSIPNALTVLRLILAIAFFIVLTPWFDADAPADEPSLLYLRGGHLVAAAVLFIIAALTDAADGLLARRWGVVSAFGRVMDPFADKLLVIGAFAYLAGPGFTVQGLGVAPYQVSGVAPWMVAVILGRELLVTSIRGVLEGMGVAFPATWSGKAKMMLQSITVPAVLLTIALANPAPGSAAAWFIRSLVLITVGITLISGWPYIRRAVALGGAPA